jgi:hypothetical protein
MFDSKFVITLTGLLIALFAVCNLNIGQSIPINEGFGMNPSMTWKVDRMISPSAAAAKRGEFYSIPGNHKAATSPRFSNVDYGANIRYNTPNIKNQGSPSDPLIFGNMANQNYRCGQNNVPQAASNEIIENEDSDYPEVSSSLPVGNMTTINASGETIQPIIYDRYIFAAKKSRLRSQADPIRGDVPVTESHEVMFKPSVQASIDLHPGALNVMGGNQNETSNKLSEMMYNSSGNASTIFGGVDMASQLAGNTGARNVHVTGF